MWAELTRTVQAVAVAPSAGPGGPDAALVLQHNLVLHSSHRRFDHLAQTLRA